MKFEQKLVQINEIIEKLESPDTTLGEGIELFEKSLELTKDCLSELHHAKDRVEIIKNQLDELVKDI